MAQKINFNDLSTTHPEKQRLIPTSVSPRHDAVIQLSAGGHLMMRIW